MLCALRSSGFAELLPQLWQVSGFCVTPLLLLQLWMLNSDSVVASVPETCAEAERSPAAAAPGGPSLRAVRALKLLYTACSHPGPQQRE